MRAGGEQTDSLRFSSVWKEERRDDIELQSSKASAKPHRGRGGSRSSIPMETEKGGGDRADHFPPSLDPLTDSANTDCTSRSAPLCCPMVVRYDNGTGGGRTDFDRPLSFMRIGVDIHREFEETAAFRSLVAKRETSPLCKWERRLLRITTCDTRRGRGGEHHQSVRRGGVGAEKIRFPLFFPCFLRMAQKPKNQFIRGMESELGCE